MACPCSCCEKTGACCAGGVCTQETCQDCETLGGQWQGFDTECNGPDCPCDPPADHTACEKCFAGAVLGRCGELQNCCDGVCQDDPCGTQCDVDEDCCVCGGSYFDVLCGDCPTGWTKVVINGECQCVSPEIVFLCGNAPSSCEDIRQQVIAATGFDTDYGERQGFCCDSECSAYYCPP